MQEGSQVTFFLFQISLWLVLILTYTSSPLTTKKLTNKQIKLDLWSQCRWGLISYPFLIELLLHAGPQGVLESVPAVLWRQQGYFNFKWAQMPHLFTAVHKATQTSPVHVLSRKTATAKLLRRSQTLTPSSVSVQASSFPSEAALWWNLKAQTALFCPPTVTSARTIWPWPTKTFPMERPEGHTETNLLWKITEEMSTVPPNTMDLAKIWYPASSLLIRSFQPRMLTAVLNLLIKRSGCTYTWGQALTNVWSSNGTNSLLGWRRWLRLWHLLVT